ncbi:tetratricopeptide repeat protein [Acuticoccus sediminis]|nr:tetratricopeptide repeat protein [Acuticoccus sediminis]
MQYLRSGELEHARAAFVAMVEANPDVTLGYIGLGEVHMQEGDVETALKYFQDALEIDPQSTMALNMSARARQRLGDIDGALEDYEESGQVDPGRGTSQIRMSQIFAREGDLEEATSRLREALKRNPQQTAARFMLASNLEKMGDVAGAKTELLRVLDTNPDMGVAAYRLSRLYIQERDYASAEPLLMQAIEQAPDKPAPYATLGAVLKAQGHTRDALDAFRAALELKPGSQPFAMGVADCLSDLGEHAEAVKVLRGVLRGSRRPAFVHKRLGDTYVAMGSYEQAIDEYRAAMLGAPEFTETHPDLTSMLDAPDTPETKARKVQAYLADAMQAQREAAPAERRFAGLRRNRTPRSIQTTGA